MQRCRGLTGLATAIAPRTAASQTAEPYYVGRHLAPRPPGPALSALLRDPVAVAIFDINLTCERVVATAGAANRAAGLISAQLAQGPR